MVPAGGDPGLDLDEAVAPEERRKRLPGIDAAAMQVARTFGQQADALRPGGGAQLQFDAGKGLVEPRDRRRQDRLHPDRVGADPEPAGKAGNRRLDLLLRGLKLAQHASCTLGGQGAEGGEAVAGRDVLEQPSAEARLHPGDGAGERRLGDGEALRRRDDLAGLGDREEAGEVCAPFEHRAACGLHRGDGRSVPLSM